MALSWVKLFLLAGLNVLLKTTQSLNVSKKCEMDTNTFLVEMNRDKPQEFAVLMYDAFGKQGSNVEGGNANRPGLLHQCRSAHSPSFSGQYCQVFLKQGTIQYFVGICVPDSCEEKEVETLVLYDTFKIRETSLILPLPSILTKESTQEMFMTHCLSDTVTPNASDVTCILVCLTMLALPLLATLLSATMKWQRNQALMPNTESVSLDAGFNQYGALKTNGSTGGEVNGGTITEETNSTRTWYFPKKCIYQCLQAFSLQTTSKDILNTSSSLPTTGYSSLNGIRILSLLWIMCGHSAQFPVINNLDNYKDWKKTVERSPLYVFSLSGPVFLAVDTFLLLGGLLSARSLLGSIQGAGDKLSPGLLMVFLFRRFKRVQPLHIFVMCLTIGFVSLVHAGPYWFPFIDNLMDCKKYWWGNLLLMSNLLPVHEICVPWTWYLSLDFQCYATTPLLIYLYRLNRSIFVAVAGGLLLMTTLASSLVTGLLQLPVFQPSTLTSENYVLYYYVKPHTRYGPFLIGIVTGIYLTTRKGQLLKHKWQALLGWLCCLLILAALIGLAYVLRGIPVHPSVPHALYQGLHRPLWALAITWIILACEDGYGGFINRFLSFSVWVPLARISFACYLIHPVFILVYIALQETPIHYTDITFMYLFLGHVVLTVGVSVVLTVLIERPYVLLKWKWEDETVQQ
ncbi:O-acyltransferase like protein [Stigmatopora nigra]